MAITSEVNTANVYLLVFAQPAGRHSAPTNQYLGGEVRNSEFILAALSLAVNFLAPVVIVLLLLSLRSAAPHHDTFDAAPRDQSRGVWSANMIHFDVCLASDTSSIS